MIRVPDIAITACISGPRVSPPGRPLRAARAWLPREARLAAALLAALLLGLAACAGGPHGGLYYVQEDQFAVRDPGGRQAAATGIGCAYSEKAALTQAQSTAHYNLRGMMGPGRYRVRFGTLRAFREGEQYCLEVEAKVLN